MMANVTLTKRQLALARHVGVDMANLWRAVNNRGDIGDINRMHEHLDHDKSLIAYMFSTRVCAAIHEEAYAYALSVDHARRKEQIERQNRANDGTMKG